MSFLKMTFIVVSFCSISSTFTSINTELPSTFSENYSALVGWKFYSYYQHDMRFEDSTRKKIFLAGLIDGTIMAIDMTNGHILWSINEDGSAFLDIVQHNNKNSDIFVPSTSGELYRLQNNMAEQVFWNKHGRAEFNKDYFISSTKQESITIGINLLSGKLYYYCNRQVCWKNSSQPMDVADYNNLLVIRRTVTVIQIIDIFNGQEIIKYTSGKHELFTYFSHDNLLSDSKEDNGITYDILMNILYGASANQMLMKSCWSIHLPSSMVSAWVSLPIEDHYSLNQLQISNILLPEQDVALVQPEENTGIMKKTGLNILYLNTHDNFPFLQNIHAGEALTYQFRIYSLLKNSQIDAGIVRNDLNNNQLNDFIFKLNEVRETSFRNNLSRAESRELRVRVTWREVSLKKNNKVHSQHDFTKDGDIIIVVSIFAFWKEIISLSVIIYAIAYCVRRYFRKMKDQAARENNSLQSNENEADTKDNSNSQPIQSRYASDFEHIETIGNGGFGTVFKCQNYLDECTYAVKRVTIPNCIVARHRVMREVKALAKLTHPNIVRFYNAWYEPAPALDIYQNKIDEDNSSTNAENVTDSKSSDKYNRGLTVPADQDKDDSETSFVIEFENSSVDRDDEKGLWDDVVSSSSNECSRSDLSNISNETDFSFIAQCSGAHGCSHDGKMYIYIQMELCHKQTLKTWLFKNLNRELSMSLAIFNQILSAISFVHSNGLMHRDLKPSNIFFAFDGSVKIGDFGLVTRDSAHVTSDHVQLTRESSFDIENPTMRTRKAGTELYMSPEQSTTYNYNHKVDIYSLGLIIFELLVPYKTQTEKTTLLSDLKKGVFPDSYPNLIPLFVNFIKWLLDPNPETRPGTEEIIGSQIMRDIKEHVKTQSV